MMMTFVEHLVEHLVEALIAPAHKLTHIHHAEDRPLLHGSAGFEHANKALSQSHEHIKSGKNNSKLTMKYDGSPSIVFGHHPKTKKFFVATKSAFNKNPKINHSDADIDQNHGHAPGLASKLKSALKHLPKVAPKNGVYQGDLMHTPEDIRKSKGGSSFTPNTITYTAKGPKSKTINRSKIGVVVHQQYHGKDIGSMKSTPHTDYKKSFSQHPDVHHHGAEHDTSKINYSQKSQKEFKRHLDTAAAIHKKHGSKMYTGTAKHQGEGGHLSTYINATVRKSQTPTASGFAKHVGEHHDKQIGKLKSEKSKTIKRQESQGHQQHIANNSGHYDNLFKMHQHLQSAKNVLVKHLESHEGGYTHTIDKKPAKPEGFVVNVNHGGESHPTKLVDRKGFARANLLKVRK